MYKDIFPVQNCMRLSIVTIECVAKCVYSPASLKLALMYALLFRNPYRLECVVCASM